MGERNKSSSNINSRIKCTQYIMHWYSCQARYNETSVRMFSLETSGRVFSLETVH